MLYAKQIPPEYQDPAFLDMFECINVYNSIAIAGNKDYKSYFTDTAEEYFDRLEEYSERYSSPRETITELKEKTGLIWDYVTIRGTCQGEWNYLYYIEGETTPEEIETLESVYFNTGAEYIIHDQETAPEGPEDIEGYSLYIPETSKTPTDPKKAIADALGTSPEEITLYLFDRWQQIPKYKEY